MKTFHPLCALGLFRWAQALSPGQYTIGSAALDPTQLLTQVGIDRDLVFTSEQKNPSQSWEFIATGDGSFEIHNEEYGSINCGRDKEPICYTGDRSQRFRPELMGGRKYEIVDVNSGYFLRANEDNELYLADWDQSLHEQFVLTHIVV